MRSRRFPLSLCLLLTLVAGLGAQSAAARGGVASIQAGPLKEWLTFLSSDELQGRATYSEGLGTAASYIAERLEEWAVKPVGDNGTYFQTVKVLGVRNNTRSTVTVSVNGQSRTFKEGAGITLPRNEGGKQTIAADVVFAGYALQIPDRKIDDYAGLDAKGKIVVWLGSQGPASLGDTGVFRLLGARGRQAIEKGAVAAIGPPPPAGGRGGRGAGGRGSQPGVDPETAPHFTTVQRFDAPVAPVASAQDDFFEFLFSGSDVTYTELKEKASKREPLPTFVLKNTTVTFNIDPDYTVVRTQLTKNVVGLVEGSDPKLKDTYVVYGAHYDHSGYRDGPPRPGRGGQPPPDPNDRIYNGADDDGSGTVAIMAIARAFAQGPKPKRSILFVWHAGEEVGLLGSRYHADYPVVPLDRMVAQLNMDMVGRNRDNKPEESDTVYVIGSDRISTELHNINEDANASLPKPLTMNYEYNDPADPQSFYTRSDHYSYAVKGIPIVFYFTGTHPDYHQVSDTVDKILFDKVQRVAQLAYETGRRVANMDRAPARDNRGPRMGKGAKGKLPIAGSSARAPLRRD